MWWNLLQRKRKTLSQSISININGIRSPYQDDFAVNRMQCDIYTFYQNTMMVVSSGALFMQMVCIIQ